MLFHSYIFLFIFLPISVIGYFWIAGKSNKYSLIWLLGASLVFYSYWNPWYVFLIISSMSVNYWFGTVLIQQQSTTIQNKGVYIMWCAIWFNILLLGTFKYTDFILSNINTFFSFSVEPTNILLPLAISFFTFQQIAYLVDCKNGKIQDTSFLHYGLFVTFFPQLIAGPIIHHQFVIPQFIKQNKRINYENLFKGLFLICIGLFKKVVIADGFAVFVNDGYSRVAELGFVDSWMTTFSYTFQLYFDFSGYIDIALGIALLFNIVLPLNFNSPYKSRNLEEFWRRWHITLGRFLNMYLYTPLKKGRESLFVRAGAVLVVFLISGFWHGAAWTFVLWGLVHGVGMTLLYIWKRYGFTLHMGFSWLCTFMFVHMSWVIFRSDTLSQAFEIFKKMFSFNMDHASFGIFSPHTLTPPETFWNLNILFTNTVLMYISITLLVVLVTRNSNEIIKDLKPSYKNLLLMFVMFIVVLYNLNEFSEFIYFRF